MNPLNKAIYFRNAVQAALYECELSGQMSDGYWENRRGRAWEDFSGAVARVDPNNVGRNFYAATTGWAFDAKPMLDVIGKRMLGYARIAHAYGFETAKRFKHMIDCEGKLEYRADSLSSSETPYVRARLAEQQAACVKAGVCFEAIMSVLAVGWPGPFVPIGTGSCYEMKDLKADLRDMKTIVKMGASPEREHRLMARLASVSAPALIDVDSQRVCEEGGGK